VSPHITSGVLAKKVGEFDFSTIGLRSPIKKNQDGYAASFLGLRLQSQFQSIIQVSDRQVLGHEALLRPTGADNEAVPPMAVFHLAEYDNKVVHLDRVSRTIHLVNYIHSQPKDDSWLFLNVNPRLLTGISDHGKTFAKVLNHYEFPANQIVIEIVEHEIANQSLLLQVVQNFRANGYRIAIDDFGVQSSNFDRVWRLSPDIVKLDGGLCREMGYNRKTQAVLAKLVSILHDLGAKVVMEGIETPEQLAIGIDAGADLVQGYFFGQPSVHPAW
jgi:EAL domain-containing protein (putative c-di-GMP-specific phosphodiesterase class I)